MLAEALANLEAMGHRAVAVPARRLDELREEYENLFSGGLLDEDFARELQVGLTLSYPETVSNPRSLIVVATRDPIVRCTFEWRGDEVSIPIPPTYLQYIQSGEDIARTLAELLPQPCQAAPLLNAPHKLLAARSHLAHVGRNNLTYIPGLGSIFKLTTVCTDVECEAGEWLKPAMMRECEGCTLCADACPTGAIPDDRIVLRAERCITHWNEKPGDVPFPDWFDPGWHNCLVGCLDCQLACPENGVVRSGQRDGPCFTEVETEALLRGAQPEDLPVGLRDKLEKWDLMVWLGALPRNLAVHLVGGASGSS